MTGRDSFGFLVGEIEELFDKSTSEEILDVIHFLRVKYSSELFSISNEKFNTFKNLLKKEGIPSSPGIYVLLTVDPERNVMLYVGKTSGKSKTSGLGFRLKDHTRLLGKTPFTLFIPNWWIRKAYYIALENEEKMETLEKRLWKFLDQHSKNKTPFNSIEHLEKEMNRIIKEEIKLKFQIMEFQPGRNPMSVFYLKKPPAGRPRKLDL